MKEILKNYVFWAYPRGSVHYDVMVTLILVFIFGSPFVINYREHPQVAPSSARGVLVRVDGHGALIYQIDAGQIGASRTKAPAGEAAVKSELLARIQAVSGDVHMDGYAVQEDARGHLIGYRVWAHR